MLRLIAISLASTALAAPAMAQFVPSEESLEGFFHDSGFIFSHSTLASFLKGLFPANSRISNPQTRLEQETVPLNSDYPLIDDESEEIPPSLNNVESRVASRWLAFPPPSSQTWSSRSITPPAMHQRPPRWTC